MSKLPAGYKRYTEEDFLAEKVLLFDPDPINPQVSHLKEGKTRDEAAKMFKKRNILETALNTRYKNGKNVAETIEDLLIKGYIYPEYTKRGVVPAVYLQTADKSQVILVSIELDYFKLLHGEL